VATELRLRIFQPRVRKISWFMRRLLVNPLMQSSGLYGRFRGALGWRDVEGVCQEADG
jgi:hypothetical protein